MKAVTLRDTLSAALGLVERASGSGAQLPALRNVLLETEGDQLVLTATNLELAVRATVAAKVVDHGKVSVPTALLGSLVGALTDERVTLEAQGSGLGITTDHYNGTLAGAPVDDFPSIPTRGADALQISIPGALFREALSRVSFAAQGAADFSPELAAVLVTTEAGMLRFVATDSFRLAEASVDGAVLPEKSVRALIPAKVASELSRVIHDDEDVACYFETHQATFETPRWQVTTRLISAQFPDYEQIIPPSFIAEFTVNREALAAALKLASVFAAKGSEITIEPSGEGENASLTISAGSDAVGSHSTSVEAHVTSSFPAVTFNWRQLSDGLRAISAERVTMGINVDKPALLRGSGEGTYRYVLAPLVS